MIDENGIARVFVEYPDYEEIAYFISPNCELDNPEPKVCEPGLPLEWNHAGEALKVYVVQGTPDGSFTFDLVQWQTGEGGKWMNVHVVDGMLSQAEGVSLSCEVAGMNHYRRPVPVHPIPTSDRLLIPGDASAPLSAVSVWNASGQTTEVPISVTDHGLALDCTALPEGIYQIRWADGACFARFMVMH